MSGEPGKIQRKLWSLASFSSEVPGSVIAANWRPAFPAFAFLLTSPQKYAKCERVSVVSPDFDGHDEQRLVERDLGPDPEDRGGVGGVEDVQRRMALHRSGRCCASRSGQGSTRPFPAERRRRRPARAPRARATRTCVRHLLGDVQPPEAVADLLALGRVGGPTEGVPWPTSAGPRSPSLKQEEAGHSTAG